MTGEPYLEIDEREPTEKEWEKYKKIKYDFKDKEKEDMMSYNEDYQKESGYKLHTISSILAFIVFLVCVLWIIFSTPDALIENDITIPLWMFIVYSAGIITTSAFIAFIVFSILESIFGKTESSKMYNRKIREPKVKRTYKF